MRLTTRHVLAEGLLDCPAPRLFEALGGPTLFDLTRGLPDPLFVSVLQHGNEVSGWDAVRAFLASGSVPPLLLYVGNVEAARLGERTLAHQQDFNRAWNGGDSPEAGLARQVTDHAMRAGPRLAIDLHNNTGINPHYGVLTDLRAPCLGAALAFSPLALLAQHRDGIQTERFAEFCPAVTLETGRVGDPESARRAAAYLATAARWREVPEASFAELTVYRNEVRVVIDEPEADFHPDAPLALRPELERFNFERLEAGNVFAHRAAGTDGLGLTATDVSGADLTDFYFELRGADVLLREPVYPSMYTRDITAVRQDCLCYFMAPLLRPPLPSASPPVVQA